jgi:hypothetical protein
MSAPQTSIEKNKIALLSHQGSDFTNHDQKIDILTSSFKNLLGTCTPNSWNFHLADIYPEQTPQLRHLDDPPSRNLRCLSSNEP